MLLPDAVVARVDKHGAPLQIFCNLQLHAILTRLVSRLDYTSAVIHYRRSLSTCDKTAESQLVYMGLFLSYKDQLRGCIVVAADKDRTISRRSEPNSRTTLPGEQTDPWVHILPQEVMSRHRGAKRCASIWTLSAHQPVIPSVPFIH